MAWREYERHAEWESEHRLKMEIAFRTGQACPGPPLTTKASRFLVDQRRLPLLCAAGQETETMEARLGARRSE